MARIYRRLATPLGRWWLAGLVVFAAAATAWGGWLCTKAREECGIPSGYNYGAVAARPPARTASTVALPVRPDPLPAASGTVGGPLAAERGAVKAFQPKPSALQIDHCAVSRLAVVIDRKGLCRISLQAEQNTPATIAEQDRRARLAGVAQGGALLQTSHIKRNEFHIAVRGYGVPATVADPNLEPLGKPVLFRVEIAPFWVQNGESRDVVTQVESKSIQEYFDQINHVEVDFWYR